MAKSANNHCSTKSYRWHKLILYRHTLRCPRRVIPYITVSTRHGASTKLKHMVRDVNHGVTLYSSIPTPPVLSSIQWGAINYILNHKQGSMMDVQNAIWHFTNHNAVLSKAAQSMVTAAEANLGYNPLTMGGTSSSDNLL